MTSYKLSGLAIILSFFIVTVPSATADNREIDVLVADITQAQPPKTIDGCVLFTYASGVQHTYVAARFESDDFASLHLYTRNEHNVFVLVYVIPEHVIEVKYRIVVDGLWQEDPFNPFVQVDSRGIPFSVFTVPEGPETAPPNPEVLPGGEVLFAFRTASGRTVSVAGDFNGWDPFSHRLHETEPGLYTTSLRLLPGRYRYRYIVNGQRTLDPLNFATAIGYDGTTVSIFYVPQRS